TQPPPKFDEGPKETLGTQPPTKPAFMPESKKTLNTHPSPKVDEGLKKFAPPSGVASPKGPPPGFQNSQPSVMKTPGFGLQGSAPKRLGEIQKGRIERIENGHKVIEEPGSRFIVKDGNRTVIRHDESEGFWKRPNAKSERRADGSVETYYMRPDGARVVSLVDGNGRLLRRYWRGRDGHEHNIIDNRRFYRNAAIGVGVGVLGIVALDLAMPHVTIPPQRYIVDYEGASDADLDEALEAGPLVASERPYSLEEILYTYALRARMRRIDLDTVNFDSGAWEVSPDQYGRLEGVAHAILRVLRRNPDAVFLVEGHTDAVGSDDDNLSLSDRRAASVAEILSDTFDVPPENLVTQGYGEQFLKINTQGPERRNRRVTVVNITPLMAGR
ncbi:MAG TPA: OmpA family protein, partial [Dehalococcoidia bacterium]